MVNGFLFSGMCAGIKQNKPDLSLVFATVPCAAAGVFTQNRARAAAVDHAAAGLPREGVRAIVTNAGNANALTGARGQQAVLEVIQGTAAALEVPESAVFSASTGVIGVPLPSHKVLDALPQLRGRLAPDPDAAADAILTTDTTRKLARRTVVLSGKTVTVLGFCKGAGMIHPALATMLGYIVTDADVSAPALQAMLSRAAARSFNRLTVDGDMSTNDSLFALASGLAGNPRIDNPSIEDADELYRALEEVCIDLARLIAADGEGATKLLEVSVTGAASDELADDLARAVAGSSLVKAALFGNDPNWGRVLSSVGARAATRGLALPVADLRCSINDLVVFDHGEPANVPQDDLRAHLCAAGKHVRVAVAVGAGLGQGLAWGCDLTYDYVKINAEYVSQTVAAPDGSVSRDGRLDNYGPTFKHRLLVEALTYIRRFTGQIAVIKYGGAAMLDEGLKRSFAEDVLRLRDAGLRPVVIHGGGPEISRTLAALGRERSTFVDGVRVTDKEDMSVVEMVLDGRINSELVALLNQGSHHAVGLTGKDGRLLEAQRIRGARGEDLGQVGEVSRVRTELLTMFLEKAYIPVISPTAITQATSAPGAGPGTGVLQALDGGGVLNVNADDAAAAVAGALGAAKLIYLCDVAGVVHNGALVSELAARDLPAALQWKDVTGGMVAKLRAVQRAVEGGVGSVHLIDGRVRHALIAELFTDAGVGTLVRAG